MRPEDFEQGVDTTDHLRATLDEARTQPRRPSERLGGTEMLEPVETLAQSRWSDLVYLRAKVPRVGRRLEVTRTTVARLAAGPGCKGNPGVPCRLSAASDPHGKQAP